MPLKSVHALKRTKDKKCGFFNTFNGCFDGHGGGERFPLEKSISCI
jgi:hypothetical protein